MSELRAIFLMVVIITTLISASNLFLGGLMSEWSITNTDLNDRDQQIIDQYQSIKNDSLNIQERDIGGFKYINGVTSAVKTLFNSVDISVGFLGDFSEKLNAPSFLQNNLTTIMIMTGILSLVGILWSKKPT